MSRLENAIPPFGCEKKKQFVCVCSLFPETQARRNILGECRLVSFLSLDRISSRAHCLWGKIGFAFGRMMYDDDDDGCFDE